MTGQTNKDPLEALSCPFCGSNDISDGEVLSTNPAGGVCTQSMCHGCGALGPEAQLAPDEIDFGDEKAIAAWNRRASAPADILRMRQQLEQEWCELQKLKASYASAPAAGSVPSDTEIKALAERHMTAEAEYGYRAWFAGEIQFARALLAQYGSPTCTSCAHEFVTASRKGPSLSQHWSVCRLCGYAPNAPQEGK